MQVENKLKKNMGLARAVFYATILICAGSAGRNV